MEFFNELRAAKNEVLNEQKKRKENEPDVEAGLAEIRKKIEVLTKSWQNLLLQYQRILNGPPRNKREWRVLNALGDRVQKLEKDMDESAEKRDILLDELPLEADELQKEINEAGRAITEKFSKQN